VSTVAERKAALRPGVRVRVVNDSIREEWAGPMGYSLTGTVIEPGVVTNDRVRVEWDNNHPGDRRPRHRETIAIEHVEPL
jgi:hypothetical protein